MKEYLEIECQWCLLPLRECTCLQDEEHLNDEEPCSIKEMVKEMCPHDLGVDEEFL